MRRPKRRRPARFARRPELALRAHGHRGGFTLIELLIAITIFLLVSAVTIAAVQGFRTSGQTVDGAARQVQSYLSGARDRAVLSARSANGPRARGVRFLPDTDLRAVADDGDGGTVTTLFACRAMQYVESAGTFPPNAQRRSSFAPGVEMLFLAGDDPGTPATERFELLPPVFVNVGGTQVAYPWGDHPPPGPASARNRTVEANERPGLGVDNSVSAALANAWTTTGLNRVFKAGLLGERRGVTNEFLARVRVPADGPWVTAAIVAAGSAGATVSKQDLRLAGIGRVFLLTAPGDIAPVGVQLGRVPAPPTPGPTTDVYEAAAAGATRSSWGSCRWPGRPSARCRPGPRSICTSPPGTGPYRGPGQALTVRGGSTVHDRRPRGDGDHVRSVRPGGRRAGGQRADPPADRQRRGPRRERQRRPVRVRLVRAAGVRRQRTWTPPRRIDTEHRRLFGGRGKLGEELIVTVNTQTGTITVSSVDTQDVYNAVTDSGTFNAPDPDGLADDPFLFAETGLEAN